jgi:hypothetical protein
VRVALCAVFLFALTFNPSAHAASSQYKFFDIRAYVTGYNTTPGQTDSTPCIAASGANICGRVDAVACPRGIELGTILQIHDSLYICEDRLAKKYDSRFDISCDKDTNCPPQVTGWTVIRIFALKAPRQNPVDASAAAPPALAAGAPTMSTQQRAGPVIAVE